MITEKKQLIDMIDCLPEPEVHLLFEIAVRFADDVATPDDLEAIRESEAEYEAGETISHDEIDWG